MPGSSKENTVAASMTPAAELSSMSRARIDKSLIVQIIKAPSNVPTLANRLARLPATIMLLSYSIMVLQQKYKYGLNGDRKSTRLNFSHVAISYAVFCLKK